MGSRLNTFDWIAHSYDRLVRLIFGTTLLRAQLSLIHSINDNESVLILGGGSGKFLDELVKAKPSVRICYIEASQKMLALSRLRVRDDRNVSFIHGTEESIPSADFDVIITNFFFDLFPENQLTTVVEKANAHLRIGGKWIVTDFENSAKIRHRILLSMMYFFFSVTKSIDATRLPDWRLRLKSQGLKVIAEKDFAKGFVKSTLLVKA